MVLIFQLKAEVNLLAPGGFHPVQIKRALALNFNQASVLLFLRQLLDAIDS